MFWRDHKISTLIENISVSASLIPSQFNSRDFPNVIEGAQDFSSAQSMCGSAHSGHDTQECYFSYTQILGVHDPQNDLIAYEDTVALRLLALTCAANQELARAA